MVKLTEVEDEHFTAEKPTPSKNDALLVSDDEEDYTDTGKYLKNPCSPAQARAIASRHYYHSTPQPKTSTASQGVHHSSGQFRQAFVTSDTWTTLKSYYNPQNQRNSI